MKKTIYILLTFSIISFSCNNTQKKNTINNEKSQFKTEIDSSNIKKERAIEILDEVDIWIRKGVTKKMPSSKVNKKIKPLMKEYMDLISKMDEIDSIYVQEYRIEQVNKVIDLQVKYLKNE